MVNVSAETIFNLFVLLFHLPNEVKIIRVRQVYLRFSRARPES